MDGGLSTRSTGAQTSDEFDASFFAALLVRGLFSTVNCCQPLPTRMLGSHSWPRCIVSVCSYP